jgi:L-iditol 2-dehydrogenase
MKSVRAAVLEAPQEIVIRDFPYPVGQKSGLIVRTELAGICGTDKHTFLGHTRQYPGSKSESVTPFPIIQGHENVGVIEEICSGAHSTKDFNGNVLRVGDRITMCPDVICGHCWYCRNTYGYPWCDNVKGYGNAFTAATPPHLFGGFAEYMYLGDEVFVYKVPESVPPTVAVLSELFTVTLGISAAKEVYSLANIGFGTFPSVLVLGVGPLGLLSIIRLRIMGCDRIIAMDWSAYRLAAAKRFGADSIIDMNEITTRKERVEFTRQLTDGLGVDLAVDCANEPSAFSEGIDHLRRVGTLIELGNFVDTGETSINVSSQVCTKNVRVIGVGNHPYTEYAKVLRMFERLMTAVPFKELISHTFSLDHTKDALLKSMEADSLKVVVKP